MLLLPPWGDGRSEEADDGDELDQEGARLYDQSGERSA